MCTLESELSCTMTGQWLVLLFLYLSVAAGKEDEDEHKSATVKALYSNHRLLSVKVNGSDVRVRESFHRLRQSADIDVWDEPQSIGISEILVRVSPPFLSLAQQFICNHSFESHLLTDNLQAWIKEEAHLNSLNILPRNGQNEEFDTTRYHTFDEVSSMRQRCYLKCAINKLDAPFQIEQYLLALSGDYANTTELVSLGKTAEGRNIWCLKVKCLHLKSIEN